MPKHIKRYIKPRRRRRRKPRVPRPTPLGLPVSGHCRMRYTEQITLDPGVGGTIATYVFRANSLFDPNYTASGHQPMTFDQVSAFYNHYVVTGARITVKSYDHQQQSANMLGIMLNDDLTVPTSTAEVIEQRKCRYKIMAPQNKVTSVSQNYSAKRFFNVSDVKDNVTRIGAPVTTDPTDQAFFTVFALPLVSGQDTEPINCIVTIDYIAQFSEPKDITSS